MGKRVGLLAGLLVLVMGSGVVAQSPSPEPSAEPLYAPEDMALLLPSEVGGIALTKANFSPDMYTALYGSDEFLRSLLLSLGKEPADLLDGGARADGEVLVSLSAMRVRGVEGNELRDAYIPAFAGAYDATYPPHVTFAAEDLGGRHVLRVRNAEAPDRVMAYYTLGEVMFIVIVAGEEAESIAAEVLADLPQ